MDNMTFRDPGPLARVFVALLALCVLARLVSIYWGVELLAFVDAVQNGGADQAAADAVDRLGAAVGITGTVLYVLAGIAFIAWFHRAYTNLAAFGVAGLRRGPGWAIGAWLIPVVSYVLPKQLHDDIWRASEPALRAPAHPAQWAAVRVPALHTFWWVAFVVANLASLISSRLPQGPTLDSVRAFAVGSLVADLLTIVAAVLVVPVLFATSARQRARAGVIAVTWQGPLHPGTGQRTAGSSPPA